MIFLAICIHLDLKYYLKWTKLNNNVNSSNQKSFKHIKIYILLFIQTKYNNCCQEWKHSPFHYLKWINDVDENNYFILDYNQRSFYFNQTHFINCHEQLTSFKSNIIQYRRRMKNGYQPNDQSCSEYCVFAVRMLFEAGDGVTTELLFVYVVVRAALYWIDFSGKCQYSTQRVGLTTFCWLLAQKAVKFDSRWLLCIFIHMNLTCAREKLMQIWCSRKILCSVKSNQFVHFSTLIAVNVFSITGC